MEEVPHTILLCALVGVLNWEAFGAIAEFLGSIGVLITVLYIAFQVRDAKRMNILDTSNSMTNNVAGRVIDNPHLAQILAKIDERTSFKLPAAKAAIDEWQLTPEEAEIWARYMGTVWRGMDARLQAGSLEDGLLEAFITSPQARLYLNATQMRFSSQLKSRIEAIEPKYFGGGT